MVSFPFCKINLGLQVISMRSDGFHNIETCFYPVPWHDVLEIIYSEKFSFTRSGISIPDDDMGNLCVLAYNKLKDAYDIPPIKMHLHKIIPMGAGLGGGSADAAFTLKSLNTLFSLELPVHKLHEIAAELGSDCSFFLQDHPMMGSGRGEVLKPIDVSLSGMFIVIVKPDVHVSTQEAYKGVIPDQSRAPLNNILLGDIEAWKDMLHNDFEASIFNKYPQIEKVKKELYNAGARYASMSGSGSSVYGLFDKPVVLKDQFEGAIYWSGNL
ncbi:MAG: 4-(cytidine 5'-diphospho)-2-C-methyl-D-erythritol kinase [Cyclobacteriaceae bacterium]|nr:4-(cytidine 5'-diphospho)-2-C-methyl-D-erythritol kinase [Cyclobacteriaceae bacterium]